MLVHQKKYFGSFEIVCTRKLVGFDGLKGHYIYQDIAPLAWELSLAKSLKLLALIYKQSY